MLTHNKDPVEDYGGDYCNDLEELIPEIDSCRWLDHSYQFDNNHWGSFADTTHVRTKIILLNENSSVTTKDPTSSRGIFMIS